MNRAMKKGFGLLHFVPYFLMIAALSVGSTASYVQAAGGPCSGSSCSSVGTLEAKQRAEIARIRSLKSYQSVMKSLLQNAGPSAADRSREAEAKHRVAVKNWVTQHYPQLSPTSAAHKSITEKEFERDIHGAPEEAESESAPLVNK